MQLNIKNKKLQQGLRVLLGRGILSTVCLIIIIIFLLSAILAPVLTSYSPIEQSLDEALQPPSVEHLFGTDNLGRDLLTRILYGARISLTTSLLASVWAAAVGMILGIIAGYIGGIVGQIIMRLTDTHLSIPPLILSMVLAAMFKGNVFSLSIVIGIAVVPTYIRVANSLALSIKENDYIVEASLIGLRKWEIVFKHLLPNCLPSLIVIFTMNLGVAIMIESSLSYLGVGITPPTPAWGSMVNDGYKYLITNPSLAIIPGLCVLLVVVAFNIVGDGLRDALDPRLRGKL